MKRPASAKERLGKSLRMWLPAAAVFAAGIAGVFGVLEYRLTHPGPVPEAVSPSQYLLPSADVSWPSAGGGADIPGWWIPGKRGAPGILLAPGIGMNRSDALSLALPLHQEGFNLLIYATRGSGAEPRGASSFGLFETGDMLAALQFLRFQPGVDPARTGIWGVDVEAQAALRAAALAPEVRAVAADGAFERVLDFVGVRLREDLGLENRWLEYGCRQAFRIVHMSSLSLISQPLALSSLSGRSLLFIRGPNRPELARLTVAVYGAIEPQKEMVTLQLTRRHLMSGEDCETYDRQVSTFFRLSLPAAKIQNGKM